MTFLYPKFLLLFGLLPLLFVWEWFRHKERSASLLTSSNDFVRNLKTSLRVRLRFLPLILGYLAFAFLIVALARPQGTKAWEEQNIEGIDIVLAMDLSSSMLIEDFKPNRMEAARTEIAKFISSRPNDNIGLVCFAGESFTASPLTIDHSVLLNRLNETVDLTMELRYAGNQAILEDGTAIGQGLVTAINRLREKGSKSKVIILLTDGVNNRGQIAPIDAAKIANELGIRIYTIGVASDEDQVSANLMSPFGGIQQRMIGNTNSVDEKTLKEIASLSDGQYFRANDEAGLEHIYKEIDSMEKQKLKRTNHQIKEEGFMLYALIALLLLLVEFILRNTYLRIYP